MDFIIASITSTAIVGIAAGSGYLQERFNVEQQLFDALPVKLQDASILLALIVVLLNWLGYYLSTGVGTARSKFNVGAPVCYPTEKEVCFFNFFLFFCKIIFQNCFHFIHVVSFSFTILKCSKFNMYFSFQILKIAKNLFL